MMFLYVLTKCLTAPGAVMRAFWEQIVLRICKVPIEDNRYLRANEMCGHVEHELADTPRHAFALCYVPMFFNILGACVVGGFASFRLFYIGQFSLPSSLADIAAIWFAFSMITNVSPLVEDAVKMWQLVYSKESNAAQKIFYAPGAVICYAWAYLDKYSIHFFLGIIVIALFAII